MYQIVFGVQLYIYLNIYILRAFTEKTFSKLDAQADLHLCSSHMAQTGFFMMWLISNVGHFCTIYISHSHQNENCWPEKKHNQLTLSMTTMNNTTFQNVSIFVYFISIKQICKCAIEVWPKMFYLLAFHLQEMAFHQVENPDLFRLEILVETLPLDARLVSPYCLLLHHPTGLLL